MRSKRSKFTMIILLLAAIVLCVSYLISMRFLVVKKEKLSIKKPGLSEKAIRILHISDVHSSGKSDSKLFIWDEIENLQFNIVVITGDFISNSHKELLPHIPYLERLSKNFHVFYVFGNHEKYEEAEVRELLEKAGVTVLENTAASLSVSGVDINIIGIRDYYSILNDGFDEVTQLFDGLNQDKFNILLSHQPQIFKTASQFDVDLVLSGHTHGGQVRIPFLPTLYAPGQGFLPEYGDGWYHRGKSSMYVSKGIGATVFPVRLFNRPEIAVIEVTE